MWHGFDIGFIHISSFGLMMFLAFLSCNLIIRKTLKEKSINPVVGDDIIFWAAIGGIVGAKFYSVIEYDQIVLLMDYLICLKENFH